MDRRNQGALLTLHDFINQWKVLLKRQQELERLNNNKNNINNDNIKNDNNRRNREAQTGEPHSRQGKNNKTKHSHEDDDDNHLVDPYDCSDMAVPNVYDKVNEMLPSLVQAWKDLDSRKITAPMVMMTHAEEEETDVSPTTNHDDGGYKNHDDDDEENEDDPTAASSKSKKRKIIAMTKKPYWFDKHVRLPENFDYTNQRSEPPPKQVSNEEGQDRVISLLMTDPNNMEQATTVSYEYELWHLFKSIPTSSQIEETLTEGMALYHTQTLHKTIAEQFRRETMDTAASARYGLYALRMRDRHDYPRSPAPTKSTRTTTTTTTPSLFVQSNSQSWREEEDTIERGNMLPLSPKLNVMGTMTLEFWRHPFSDRSQPTPDSSRMVLEFKASQTLLDVHRAILDLTQDDFWQQVIMNKKKKKKKTKNNIETQQQHNNNSSNGVTVGNNDGPEQEEEKDRQCKDEDDSGFFFVEGTFYYTGDVDYVTPIQNWLLSGNERQRSDRAMHLGLSSSSSSSVISSSRSNATGKESPFPTVHMDKVRLESMPVRLGTRYVHIHHGDVECSFFVVDFQCYPLLTTTTTNTDHEMAHAQQQRQQESLSLSFPRIHDIWNLNCPTPPECQACQRRLATLVTSTYCEQTNGHKALCHVCAQALDLPVRHVQYYSIWHGQTELSTGTLATTTTTTTNTTAAVGVAAPTV